MIENKVIIMNRLKTKPNKNICCTGDQNLYQHVCARACVWVLCSRLNIQLDLSVHVAQSIYLSIYLFSSSSSSCCAASTDIPDPLSPLLPIVHRLWQVFRATFRILTSLLLYVCSSWSSCFCSPIYGDP